MIESFLARSEFTLIDGEKHVVKIRAQFYLDKALIRNT